MPDGVSKEVTDEATEQGSTGTENAGQSVPNVLYKVSSIFTRNEVLATSSSSGSFHTHSILGSDTVQLLSPFQLPFRQQST